MRRCPLEFKVRYIENRERLFKPTGLDTMYGRVLQAVVGDYYRHFEPRDPYTRLVALYDRRKPSHILWTQDTLNEQRVLNSLRLFAESPLAKREPVHVEFSCSAHIAGVVFKGRADLLCVSRDRPRQLSLVEFKLTGAEFEGISAPDRFLQPAIYFLGLGRDERTATKFLATYVFETGAHQEVEIDQELLQGVKEIVQEAVSFAKGFEFPPRLNAYCPDCGYNTLCPAYSNRDVLPTKQRSDNRGDS